MRSTRTQSYGSGERPRGAERTSASSSPLLGFGHIDRYWDGVNNTHAAKILPGEFYVTRNDELVVTVLGSCIAACIRDPEAAIGGMNHFMLPGTHKSAASLDGNSDAMRYGTFAMERLINELLKYGGDKRRLEVKLFGGGQILSAMTDIGNQNIEFVRDFLREEGLSVIAEDLGDCCPRKVYYFPHSGRVRMKRLRSLHNDTIERREREHMEKLRDEPVHGDVELF